MKNSRTLQIALSLLFVFGLAVSPLKRLGLAQGQGQVHEDDPCTHLPDPPGKANGIEKQCPALGSSSGIAKGDFNGDGFADLAIGEPGATIGGASGAGDVIILYGSINGITTSGKQLWDESRLAGNGPAAQDNFGAALASGDFNGDGYADLAIGIPNKDFPDPAIPGLIHTNEGAVIIIYGSSSGLTSTDPHVPAPQFIDFASVQSAASICLVGCAFNLDNAHFGQSLAWGNFNGDQVVGRDIGDLAIGVPTTSRGLGSKSGAVMVLLGAQGSGLTLDHDRTLYYSESNFSGSDTGNDGEKFGAALTVGDYDGDGFSDLVIGAPGRNLSGVTGAGLAFWLRGRFNMLQTLGVGDVTSIVGQPLLGTAPKANDNFGGVLATGDFNGDGKSDLAFGVPNFDIGSLTDAGVVVIRFGGVNGLTTNGLQQLWTGATFHPAVNEGGARFGAALTAGDFNADGASDLAIGVPFKDLVVTRNGQLTALQDAGEVDVIYGSAAALLQPTNGPGAQIWNQENLLGAGHASAGSRFGAPLTAWNFGLNELTGFPPFQTVKTTADLVVGVPFQDVNGISGAGAVNVIYGSFNGHGLGFTFAPKAFTADSIGFGSLAGAHFGAGLY
jgi:hypothetical protein